MRTLGSVILLGCVLAPYVREDVVGREQKRLQGTWKVSGGRDREGGPPGHVLVIVEGNRAALVHVDEDRRTTLARFTVKLDPGRRPSWADLTIDYEYRLEGGWLGRDVRPSRKGQTLRAIYALEGDTLKVCVSPVGKDRPRRFPRAPAKEGGTLLVLKRLKR
jgi:uncharacterized protein (TIGR03067 family)